MNKEHLASDTKLWDLDNIVLTPHTSGIIEHFREAIFLIFKENLLTYVESGSINKNEHNKNKGY